MTSLVDRPGDAAPRRTPTLLRPAPPATAPWRRLVTRHAVGLVAAGVVALRLPLLHAAPGADEAGFLMVGGQWHAGGSSLYGDYWVDRPPLLVTVFHLAARMGGLVPLRLIGCLAAVVVVLGVARVARRIGGDAAAPWAALAAGAWLVSGLTGSAEVNGELLAAPFVVWGVEAALAALGEDEGGNRTRTWWRATGAGAAAVAAVLVKQNFADVAVFLAALLALALLRREVGVAHAVRVAAGAALGAAGCLGLVAGWTLLHGTSLRGVYDAMYPFRIHAAHVIATSAGTAPSLRLGHLGEAWVLSGLAPVTVALVAAFLTRRLASTAAWALAALLAFDVVSVLVGGSYWTHYLLQLIVPLSVLAGVAAARSRGHGRDRLRILLVAVAISGVLAWAVVRPTDSSASERVGTAIGDAARPGDTIVTVYGRSSVDLAAGLSSPYPYLWSLPLRTLDPHLDRLDAVLTGPRAPTWFVVWSHLRTWGVTTARTRTLLHDGYHPVAVLDGHTVYLRDGVDRPTPTLPLEDTATRSTP